MTDYRETSEGVPGELGGKPQKLGDELLDLVERHGLAKVMAKTLKVPLKWERREAKRIGQFYPAIAREVLRVVAAGEEIGNLRVQALFLEADTSDGDEGEKRRLADKHAGTLLGILDKAGLLWNRGSHYESRAALQAAVFSEEHLRRNPADNLRPLPDPDDPSIREWMRVPGWAVELSRDPTLVSPPSPESPPPS